MTTVIERFEHREAEDDFRGVRNAQRMFSVFFDAGTGSDENDAVAACGVTFGSLHPRVSGIFATNVRPRARGDALDAWDVTWQYTNDLNQNEVSGQAGGSGGGSTGNPVAFEWPWGWENEEFDEPVAKGLLKTGSAIAATVSAITNSAGDAFDPPLTKKSRRMVFRLTRNELASTPQVLYYAYNDVINDGEIVIGGFSFGEAELFASVRASRLKYLNGITYRTVQYEVRHSGYFPDGEPITWDPQILDAGFREEVGGEKFHIYESGQPVTTPWPLNGSGVKQAVGDTPVFRQYRIHRAVDFSAFNFPVALDSGNPP